MTGQRYLKTSAWFQEMWVENFWLLFYVNNPEIKWQTSRTWKGSKVAAGCFYLQLFISAAAEKKTTEVRKIRIYGGKLVTSPPPSTSLLRRLSSPSIWRLMMEGHGRGIQIRETRTDVGRVLNQSGAANWPKVSIDLWYSIFFLLPINPIKTH